MATNPNVTARDFGNSVPAILTVEKQLWPSGDQGRFDLIVNGRTVVAAAGDGGTVTIPLPPGTYNVSESAVAGTDAAAYDSTVSCRTVTRRRGVERSGQAWNGLVLTAGNHAACTFVNMRKGLVAVPVPEIALEKSGPAFADAGDTLGYTLSVTNPGQVAIPADGVSVTDSSCDDPPALTSKNGDTSVQTLDFGDTWTYACSRKTPAPGASCERTVVTNTATASGAVGGATVTDDGSITTTVTCPGEPPEPPLPPTLEPGPEPPPVPSLPGPSLRPEPAREPPFVPPGPGPPDAGTAGAAGLTVSTMPCITRASQVQLTGQRMSTIRVSVDGRRLGSREIRLLQRRVLPLNRVFSPGRHRLAIRVGFEEGSATAPATLARTLIVCSRAATRAPRFTG